jgi:hypothetical protein
LGFQIGFEIPAMGIVTGRAVGRRDGIMNIFAVPVFIVTLETDVGLIYHGEFMEGRVPLDFMALSAIAFRREMQALHLLKTRVAFGGDTVVGRPQRQRHHP